MFREMGVCSYTALKSIYDFIMFQLYNLVNAKPPLAPALDYVR